MRRRFGRLAMAVGASVVTLGAGACGGSSCDSGPGPDVCAVAPAVAAVQAELGADVEFFEVAAYPGSVSLVVKSDAGAAGYQYVDESLTFTVDYPDASGAAFSAAAIDFDPQSIFAEVRDELDDPAIIDFAVTGGPGGTAVYDARIRSQKGGDLLVQLGAEGAVLGVQAD